MTTDRDAATLRRCDAATLRRCDAAELLERLASGGARRRPKVAKGTRMRQLLWSGDEARSCVCDTPLPSRQVAKGTRDYLPEQMRVREKAFGTIRSVFKVRIDVSHKDLVS